MSFAFLLNPNGVAFGNSAQVSPVNLAVQKLRQNPQANKKLSRMRIEVSELSGSLNIFDTTMEDMQFFSKILNNEDCSYVDVLRLTSFYY